ncbi:hypothetical protein [Granulicella arctica]|uniref:Peptidase M50 n=1 Tax=Granulicella arctica TaxID=940613 RepID=A0A7Y9PEP9_9BACT|nr:hypothetical protein [Granulicella arctica]NYF78315.1 hypothetical protein [Granulicella arctica]
MLSDRKNTFGTRVGFALVFIVQLWLAHALGYLVHEYAHSFVAWGSGYKANPLALDYGHLSWDNVIYLDDIDENVDYDPIFAAGRGWLAALIAVAGVLFGNGLFYLLSRRLYATAKEHGRHMLALFMFLFCMMNAGNFISYVPARTFTTHADMFTVERGLNISPWWVALVLGIPFCAAVWHFFARLLPGAMRFFFPHAKLGQIFLVFLSAYTVFKFFGSAGLHRYGDISHWISALSVYVLFPLAIILCWPRRSSEALTPAS